MKFSICFDVVCGSSGAHTQHKSLKAQHPEPSIAESVEPKILVHTSSAQNAATN
jgi:hypothetical protein